MTDFTALIALAETGELMQCDGVEAAGRLWLVPEWLEAPELGERRPVRIILMDQLSYQKLPLGQRADYLVNEPIPTSVLAGHIPHELAGRFHVEERPDVIRKTTKSTGTLQ